MVKQIENTGGNWPTTKEILVNNYLKIFVQFVKSIDFSDLVTLHYKRQTDRQIERLLRVSLDFKILLPNL